MTDKLKRAANTPIMDIIFKGVAIIVIPWGVWVTSNIFVSKAFQNRGDRFTVSDGYALESVSREEAQKTREMLHQFEMEFSRNFVRHSELKLILERQSKNNKQ